MAYGLTAAPKHTEGSIADREAAEVAQAGSQGGKEGAVKGALSGAMTGAAAGAPLGPFGLIGGLIIGAAAGAGFGGQAGQSEAAQAKIEEQRAQRSTDILTRQGNTAKQQEARAAKASTVKASKPTAPAMPDVAVSAMPTASGKGTAYDSWHSSVYGG